VKLLSNLKFFKIHLLALFFISCTHEIACDAYGDIVGGKWGFISCTGKVIVPLVHSSYEEAQKHVPQRVEKLKQI
jgi:hypothetical protein